MKRKIKICLLFFMLFSVEATYSQSSCISAGDITLPHYTDLIPDVKVTMFGTLKKYDLDINGDNIYDFTVSTWFYLGGWGFQSYAKIEGIGKNKVLANSVSIDLPDTLKQGAAVCDSAVWRFAGYFYETWGSSVVDHWANLPDRYVGLKIKNDVDSTLGWVQIFSNGSDLIIKDYACDIPQPKEEVVVYPNPTNDFINVYLSNNYSSPYTIQLYNSRGDIAYQNYGNEKKIDVHGMTQGIYVLRLITKEKTISQKIIITPQK